MGSFTSHWVVWTVKGCETGPTVYSPYQRRLESLTICGCNYKGSTFSSVISRPWVLVWPEWNSRSPAWQPDAQPTEPPVHKCPCNFKAALAFLDFFFLNVLKNVLNISKHKFVSFCNTFQKWPSLSKSLFFIGNIPVHQNKNGLDDVVQY